MALGGCPKLLHGGALPTIVRRIPTNESNDVRVSRCEYNGREFISLTAWFLLRGEDAWKPKKGKYVSMPLRQEFRRQLILGLAEALDDAELVELLEPFCAESAPVA